MFAVFNGNGPYKINDGLFAEFRNTTWIRQFNMLYIDCPVGTGFSFTEHDDGYPTSDSDVGRDLFEALQQFFTMFHEYANNPFYVAGELYAGKLRIY